MPVAPPARTSGAASTEVVECARCRVAMGMRPSAARGEHYLECPSCRARFASTYSEVFRAETVTRRRRRTAVPTGDTHRWERIRARAEAWSRRLESSDPYQVLDLRPGASFSEIRARYHALAAEHHPDRGGDAERMRAVIEAYQVLRARAARRPKRIR